jgi:predicted TIM-barrel fold metal-dependent hydrolase
VMIDGIPVIDAVIHAYNLDPSNYAGKYADIISELVYGSVVANASPGVIPTKDAYLRDWSIEETASMVFVESDADLAVHHVLPIYAFRDGLCSLEKTLQAKQNWPDRVLTYCGVDPLAGSRAMDELERQVELLDPIGLKLYPNSWVGSEVQGWKMDDPEVAFPFFDRAQALGLKVVAVHKALPLGPVPMEHYRMDDIDRAAAAFPELQFEVVHGGMAFLEETAWQLARFANVWVNLEVTVSLLAKRPKAFQHALAALMSVAGDAALDRICWGTGAVAFHPQPLLEAFVREFEFDEQVLELTGLSQITHDAKRKVLADNYARMIGLDLPAALAAIKGDDFAVRRGEGAPVEAFTTTHAAGHVI